MKPQQFDDLTRLLTQVVSRRAVLRTLVGVIAADLFSRDIEALAPAVPAGAAVPDPNVITGTCDQIGLHTQSPGVRCSEGTFKPDAEGCTTGFITLTPTRVDPLGSVRDQTGKGWIACASVYATFSVTSTSTQLTWQPIGDPCCPALCDAEYRRWSEGVAAHEARHRSDNAELVGFANKQSWNPKRICARGATKAQANALLRRQIDDSVAAAQAGLAAEAELIARIFDKSPEGDVLPLDCGMCQAATGCSRCEDGRCVVRCPACETCTDGACVQVDCGSPCLICQNDACVQKDCGLCATCDAASGSCVGSSTDCGGQCVDLMTDPTSCGECHVRCGPCETCQGGRCVKAILPPCTKCDASGHPQPCSACESCDASGQCVSGFNECQRCTVNPDGTTTVTYLCGPCEVCSPSLGDPNGTCQHVSCGGCRTPIPTAPCCQYNCFDATGRFQCPCHSDGLGNEQCIPC